MRNMGYFVKKNNKIVLYDGIDFEITLREVMFSLLILGIFSFLGFIVHSWIDKKVDDSNLKYRQAVALHPACKPGVTLCGGYW